MKVVKNIEKPLTNGSRCDKMRQPTAVDFNYKVSIMTNRYTTINEFNEVIQRLFNARQCYIAPNGHYMSIVVETISDESEYNIQDRQFFSQTVNLKLKGYIIREEDFRVEENPIATVLCFEGDNAKRRKPLIELSEYEPICVEEKELCKQEIDIDVDFSYCFPFKGKTKFTMDEDFILTNLILEDNNNIVENNIYTHFYVAKHNYESGLNGNGRTLLVRKYCYGAHVWGSDNINAYATSDIDRWLNTDYKALLDKNLQNAIGNSTFYYTPGNGDSTVATLTRSIFLLSLAELGLETGSSNVEGVALPNADKIVLTYDVNDDKTEIYSWTRTPKIDTTDRVYYTEISGSGRGSQSYGATDKEDKYVRPSFTLPSTALFNEYTMSFKGV